MKFERLLGKTLAELGYEPATNGPALGLDSALRTTRRLHRAYFAGKLKYKNSGLVRLLRRPMTGVDLDEIVLAEDHPPLLKPASTKSL